MFWNVYLSRWHQDGVAALLLCCCGGAADKSREVLLLLPLLMCVGGMLSCVARAWSVYC
jgi:hypothetical protein